MRIVISYRRRDTPGGAHRLRASLAQHFGRENVFLDIDSIPPGEDWMESIRQTVVGCDVLLAAIGLHWLEAKDERGNRLADPNDVLRFEIETALETGVRVIPVQLHGAPMPSPAELPASLSGLTRRQSIRIDDDDWDDDVGKLIRALEAEQPTRTRAEPSKSRDARAAERENLSRIWRESELRSGDLLQKVVRHFGSWESCPWAVGGTRFHPGDLKPVSGTPGRRPTWVEWWIILQTTPAGLIAARQMNAEKAAAGKFDAVYRLSPQDISVVEIRPVDPDKWLSVDEYESAVLRMQSSPNSPRIVYMKRLYYSGGQLELRPVVVAAFETLGVDVTVPPE